MHDMGYKDNYEMEAPRSTKKEKNPARYPVVHLHSNVPDFIMDKDVGNKCKLMIEVELVQKGINDHEDRKEESAELKITGMEYVGKAGRMTKDEYKNASDKDREDYDKRSVGLK